MFDFLKKKVLVGRVNAKYTFKDDSVKFHFNLFVKGTKRAAQLVVTQNKECLRQHSILMAESPSEVCTRHHMYHKHVEPWLAGEDLELPYVVKHRDLISKDLRTELMTYFDESGEIYKRLKKAIKL